ncbi:peptide-methionine (S)-S-oxide reductase MsrA [Paenibacillus sp. PL2-23]|uniref:peptide-methionine (S)-S-oxide reductase MsrA n=1 Tax=Paenibacillus sp. PL2-23 TaxID=2100729 RepID=UPI0030F9231F
MNDEAIHSVAYQPQFNEARTATFGMGCFWSPEALFGQLPGVIRTRVGYAGGQAESPTYREMGDHTETVQIVYDPGLLTLPQIASLFWDSHKPANINDYKGRQYQSLFFYEDDAQRADIESVLEFRMSRGLERPDTEIALLEAFYPAEERHQKYYLKRFPRAMDMLLVWYGNEAALNGATLAARLNGLAKGYANMERIKREVAGWPMNEEERSAILEGISRIKW